MKRRARRQGQPRAAAVRDIERGNSIAVARIASDLWSRAQLAARAGLTFAGKRDLYEALGYPRTLQAADYRDRYRRGGIAARIVEAMPKATWRSGIEIIEDEDPETETEFERAWEEIEERLTVWSMLKRADVLAGLGRYAVILIGAAGDPAQELGKISGPEGVLYLAPYGEDEAQVATWDDDTESPRFGLPLTYTITRATISAKAKSIPVHHSRVIHVADELLDDRVAGQPRLERVWNDLDNLDKIVGAGSEAFWRRVHQGMQVNVDKDVRTTPEDIDKLKDQIQEFENGMRRTLMTRGATAEMFGSDVADFSNQITAILSLLSGATGIPQRILLGSERGELASTQDKAAWDERVQDRRDDFAEPFVIRPLISRLMEAGALPQVEKYEVRWPKLDELTEAEKADIATKWADLNTKTGDVVVTAAEIRDRVLGLEKLEDVMSPEELAIARDEAKPEPPVLVAPPGGPQQQPDADAADTAA